MDATLELSDPDIRDLLDVINDRYGYDYRNYSRAHVKRRLLQRLRLSKLENADEFKRRILDSSDFARIVIRDLSINVTEMFRDPEVYRSIRELVVPQLKTWSFIRIWHAGCSTGEEVYSMAILLQEAGLYDRTQIYATDFNESALAKAKEGIFSTESIKKYATNYHKSGAKGVFSDYIHSRYDSVIMNASLKRNIVWGHHNLVTDSDFAETQLVMCRNVLIYFDAEMQNRAHQLFHRSLSNGGILCLGKKETLHFSKYKACFSELHKNNKIYKKSYTHGQ